MYKTAVYMHVNGNMQKVTQTAKGVNCSTSPVLSNVKWCHHFWLFSCHFLKNFT